MLRFEQTLDDAVTPAPVDDGDTPVVDVPTDSPEPSTGQEGPTGAAARMLELAASTAEELVANAHVDAESLVTTAQAKADAILEASRTEANRIEAELARSKEQQTADLVRERATALAGLAEEKSTLESQIADLRSLQSDHRSQMRRHLTEQLELLDLAVPESPVDVGSHDEGSGGAHSS